MTNNIAIRRFNPNSIYRDDYFIDAEITSGWDINETWDPVNFLSRTGEVLKYANHVLTW